MSWKDTQRPKEAEKIMRSSDWPGLQRDHPKVAKFIASIAAGDELDLGEQLARERKLTQDELVERIKYNPLGQDDKPDRWPFK